MAPEEFSNLLINMTRHFIHIMLSLDTEVEWKVLKFLHCSDKNSVLCEHVYNLTIAQLRKDFHKNFTQVKRKSGSAWIPFNTPPSISTDGRRNVLATLLVEVSYHKI